MVNQFFLTKGYEAFRAYFLESVGELQVAGAGPERGGIDSAIELAMAKQVYKEIDHLTTTSWSLAEILTVLTGRPHSKKF